MASKRGKDKESFTNMTHERRFFNGWVVRLSTFEVLTLPPLCFFLTVFEILHHFRSHPTGVSITGGWRERRIYFDFSFSVDSFQEIPPLE